MPVVPGTACSFVAPVVEDIGAAKVRDVSIDGLGLIISRKTDVGSLLAVTLSHAERNFTKTVLLRVVHVTSVPGGYLVGGTLSIPLTYQELTTLVM